MQIDLVNCVQAEQSAELLYMPGRCRVVQDKHGGPQAMGRSRAVGDEMPVRQLEEAHEGSATKSGLRNPPMENICIGLSCGADQCGFN